VFSREDFHIAVPTNSAGQLDEDIRQDETDVSTTARRIGWNPSNIAKITKRD
jgi:hypothetical protein